MQVIHHLVQHALDALPHGSLKVLRNVDHFATPEAFGFIDAALEFLDAVHSDARKQK